MKRIVQMTTETTKARIEHCGVSAPEVESDDNPQHFCGRVKGPVRHEPVLEKPE